MKRVIVTGANGFIGSSLTKRLLQAGTEVVAIDISFQNSRLAPSKLLTTIETQIDNSLTEKIPAGDYDAFYHLAWRGVNGQEKADPDIQLANVNMAIICAKACKTLGVPRLLCAGTVAENAVFSLPYLSSTNGGMIYGTAKHTCHLFLDTFCKNIGVNCIWMQFSNIYGIGNMTGNLVSYTLQEILADKDATFGPAQQPYDFIYIDDLIEAIVRLGDAVNSRTTYFIGSGSPRPLHEYLSEIGSLSGRQERIKIGIRNDDGVRYDFSMFDTSPLRQDIGEYNTTPFGEGIKKTISWMLHTDE